MQNVLAQLNFSNKPIFLILHVQYQGEKTPLAGQKGVYIFKVNGQLVILVMLM